MKAEERSNLWSRGVSSQRVFGRPMIALLFAAGYGVPACSDGQPCLASHRNRVVQVLLPAFSPPALHHGRTTREENQRPAGSSSPLYRSPTASSDRTERVLRTTDYILKRATQSILHNLSSTRSPPQDSSETRGREIVCCCSRPCAFQSQIAPSSKLSM